MKYDKNLLEQIHASSDLIPKEMYKDKPITLQNVVSINHKFMGGGMSQNYFALPWFEYYFDTHNFEYIVEIGSQKGCLSTYFANFAGITEKCFFDTFELYPEKDWNTREHEGCGHWFEKLAEISPFINFYHDDIFKNDSINHITENISQLKTFVFCDGGDKIKEFNTFAPLLKKGDCIAVHDWGHEIALGNIQKAVTDNNLVMDEPFAHSATDFRTLIMPFKKN